MPKDTTQNRNRLAQSASLFRPPQPGSLHPLNVGQDWDLYTTRNRRRFAFDNAFPDSRGTPRPSRHTGINHWVQNPVSPPPIRSVYVPFRNTTAPDEGVPFAKLLFAANPSQEVVPPLYMFQLLPREWANASCITLNIQWPGYDPISSTIQLRHPSGEPLMLFEMALAIARIFERFNEKCKRQNVKAGGLLVSDCGLSHLDLRLWGIWTTDGHHWHAEVSYAH